MVDIASGGSPQAEPSPFRRTYDILQRRYVRYLFPAMVTTAAASLNEFVDSMVVSRLLDDEALAIVGLGSPLMMAYAAIFMLFGVGGSMNYAIALGRRDDAGAGRSFSVAMAATLVASVTVMVSGLLFMTPLSRVLCPEATLRADFVSYAQILLLSAPLLTATMTLTQFLTPAGRPFLETIVSVVANVVNIAMDFLYIGVLGMGVVGAAWATLTGYAVAAVIVIVLAWRGRLPIHVARHVPRLPATLGGIVRDGSPDAITQLGFALQIGVCNALAAACAGKNGVVAYSVCQQTGSMISILAGAIIGVSIPLMSVMHGQRDFGAERWILKTTVVLQELIGIGCAVAFAVFASRIAGWYNVVEPRQLALAVRAVRIYTVMYVFRCFTIFYFRYLKIVGMSGYALLVSALDGFLGIIPVAWVGCQLWGIDGLWLAFPLTALSVVVMTLLVNRRIAAASEGRYSGLLLFEQETSAVLVMDVSIGRDSAQIAGLGDFLQELCESHGMSHGKALRAALAVEEMAVYASGREDGSSSMDFLVHLEGDTVVIDFRNIGSACDPLVDMERDIPENVRVLRGIADSIESESVMGMNSVRITLSA